MKLSEIVNSLEPLQNLLKVSLPIKVSYKLSKIAIKINPELDLFNEKKNELIKKYGKEIEPDKWQVDPENVEKYQEDMKTLLDMEVSLDFGDGKNLEKIPISDFGEVNIPAQDLLPLDWLISE